MQIENWNIKDTKIFENTTLRLSGADVRKMLFFKPYILAFFHDDKPMSAEEAISSTRCRNMELIINSNMITGALLAKGLKEGLARTSYGQTPELQSSFDKILSIFAESDINVGDRFDLFYSPDNSLKVYQNESLKFTETNETFIKAIYGIWFSDKFDQKIRANLLGQ